MVRHDIKQSFSGYCWTIFKNTIKDYFKKNTDLPFTELESRNEDNSSFEENIIDEEDLTEFLETDFKFEQIQKAMKELDDLSKDIVYRKFIEEKSYDEIGLLLNISQENIRQKVSRAIKQLKQLLE
ncbi:sigma-70 family RNA polymerase sigma factor [Patescibacteria group bacterium]|nr:sigma-70 family RNA polymerase sigma factor [Patescibacteria group bacterium]MBU1758774.1 sigma-70 family RNA polymerase sigma factor [Patescibacteria group bacterium]